MADKYESPKKKKKLSLNRLRQAVQNFETTLGHIRNKGSKAPVESGFLHDVRIRCVLADFRHGRLPLQSFPSFSFVTVADATGNISIGMSVKDCKLDELRLPEQERNDQALCYGIIELKGNISWSPSKLDSSVPTFIFNKGLVSQIDVESDLKNMTGNMIPTSDVLAEMCRSRFFEAARFTTPVIVGKIDGICSLEDKSIVLSIEDPVGYLGIEITEAEDGYVKIHGLKESIPVCIAGPLRLKLLQEDTNPDLTSKASDISVSLLSDHEFSRWISEICNISSNDFQGDAPENM